MKNPIKSRRIAFYHCLCWLVFIFCEISLFSVMTGLHPDLWNSLVYYTLNIALFYSCITIAFPISFGRRGSPWLLLPLAFVTLMILYICFCMLGSVLIGRIKGVNYVPAFIHLVQFAYRGAFFVLLAAAYWFPGRLISNREKLLAAQNAYLRSRLNPHLLFNTLHFLQDHAFERSPAAAEAIVTLAEVMRYSLKEPAEDGKLFLADEIGQIRNYIALNQLRSREPFALQFTFSTDDEQARFIPLLLLSLVENCFTHGNLADPMRPAAISISVNNGRLLFQSRNALRSGRSDGGGIGISNNLIRLENYYPGRYEFKAIEDGDAYLVELSARL